MGLNLLRRHRVETAGPTVADVVDRDPADLQAELERQYDELADMVARLSGGERIVALGRFAEDTRQAVMARLATIDAEASRTPEALLGRVEAALSQAADDAAAAALAGDTQSVEAIRALQGRLIRQRDQLRAELEEKARQATEVHIRDQLAALVRETLDRILKRESDYLAVCAALPQKVREVGQDFESVGTAQEDITSWVNDYYFRSASLKLSAANAGIALSVLSIPDRKLPPLGLDPADLAKVSRAAAVLMVISDLQHPR